MAHSGSKELVHRQQFVFWKNYRNNRLKHIKPRPLPEPAAAPSLSPMLYGLPSGSVLPKNGKKCEFTDDLFYIRK